MIAGNIFTCDDCPWCVPWFGWTRIDGYKCTFSGYASSYPWVDLDDPCRFGFTETPHK